MRVRAELQKGVDGPQVVGEAGREQRIHARAIYRVDVGAPFYQLAYQIKCLGLEGLRRRRPREAEQRRPP